MRVPPFALERWLLQPSELELAGAGISKLRLRDITGPLDPDIQLAYGMTNGSELLRGLIARLYPVATPEQVLVTSGTAEANFLALFVLLAPGDEFVACRPAYMQQAGIAESLGAHVKFCELDEQNGYALDLQKLADLVSPRTKVICLVNPNNPTGALVSPSEMQAVCEIADRVGAWVLCDGALRGLETEGKFAATPLEYGRGIATGSLSKVGIMGIRIGWLVAPPEVLRRSWELKDYTTLSHSGIGELLAVMALESEKIKTYFDRAHRRIRDHRQILATWIQRMVPLVDWVPPKAGHTAFLRYDLDIDSYDLCGRLLAEEGVLLAPGDSFNVPGHVRLRYSCEPEVLDEALLRIERFLRSCCVSADS